jgi:hypothetical protein
MFFFLVAAVLAILAVPLSHREHWNVLRLAYRSGWLRGLSLWDLVLSELGTATVTYAAPVSGTTAPTTTQMANQSSLTVQVLFGDSDTTATITHNMQVSAAALLRLQPWVQHYWNTSGSALASLIFTLATNTIVITKQGTSAGSGGTATFVVQRPHSILEPNF